MNDKTPPAYLIARMHVNDPEEYLSRYGRPVYPLLQAAGGEILAVSENPEVAEGEWDSNWTLLVKFPSMAALKKYYTSNEYAPYLSMRVNELTGEGAMVFVEGFDPASVGL